MFVYTVAVGCCDVLFSVNVSGLESLLFSPIFFVIRDKIISGRVYTHRSVLNRDATISPRAWLAIKNEIRRKKKVYNKIYREGAVNDRGIAGGGKGATYGEGEAAAAGRERKEFPTSGPDFIQQQKR